MPDLRVAIAYDCLFPFATGGGERVYRRIAESLVARGAAVTYVTRDQWPPNQNPDAPFRVAPIWRGEIYDANGSRTPRGALSFAVAVYRFFRAHRTEFDIVIASALPVLTMLAARAALVGSRTFVFADWLEVWTWRKWREYSGVLAGSMAFVLQVVGIRSAHAHTVNSSFTARRMVSYRRRADPIVLGLVDLVEPSTDRRTAAEPPFVLFVGRHIPDKRVHAIPGALVRARQSHPTLRAVIAGTGPDTDRVRAEISRLGLQKECTLVGRVGDDAVHALMANAVALVNPSAREGFGLVVAEAATFGTPSVVVAGEDNAAVDLVVPGVNGEVAASADAEALAGAISRVVSAGTAMRAQTAKWFDDMRRDHGLEASVDVILARYASREGASRARRNADAV